MSGDGAYSQVMKFKSDDGSLKIHVRIHAEEKTFFYTVCTKSFTKAGNLKLHMRTHSREQP